MLTQHILKNLLNDSLSGEFYALCLLSDSDIDYHKTELIKHFNNAEEQHENMKSVQKKLRNQMVKIHKILLTIKTYKFM